MSESYDMAFEESQLGVNAICLSNYVELCASHVSRELLFAI